MADATGRALLEIRTNLDSAVKDLGDLKEKLRETADSTRGISQLFNLEAIREFGRVGLEAFVRLGEGILELGERGAAVTDMRQSFEALTASTGETADAMLGRLREGVKGTIDDFSLMQLSNKALGAGLVTNAADMQTLAEGARSLGKAAGQDTKTALEGLLNAIASGRTTQLKQMNLFVDTKAAVERYANAHQMAVGDLTDHQRAAAIAAETVARLKDRMREIPPEAADFGEMIEQGKAALLNFRDAVAESVSKSPVLMAGLRAIGDEISKAFGGDKQTIVQAMTQWIERFTIGLAKTAQIGVEAAGYITDGWFALRYVFNATLETLASALQRFQGFLADAATKASKIPLLGAGYGELAGALRSNADAAEALAYGFGEQKRQAVDASTATAGALGKVDQALGRVVTAMQAAGNAHTKAAEVARKAAPILAADPVPPQTEANRLKIEETLRKLNADVAALGKQGIDQRLAQAKTEYDKTVAAINALHQISVADKNRALDLARQRYNGEVQLAQSGADRIRDTRLKLEQAITLSGMTAMQARIQQLQNAEAAEIQGLADLKLAYGSEYTEIVALVRQRYAQLIAQAQNKGLSVGQAAEQEGFKTKAELQATADFAMQTYEAMKASGKYTAEEIAAAWARAEEAKQKATGSTLKTNLSMTADWAENIGGLLTTLGGKNKTIAIAGAVISTYAHVAKTLATVPWPLSIAAAALALAEGMVQVSKIKSSPPGYKEGTPSLDYVDFGSVSMQPLHGIEAVVPQGGGHKLAGEIAAALPKATASAASSSSSPTVEAPTPVQATLVVEGRKLGELLFQLSRTKQLRILSTAVVST
jgi:hypothetical protein